MLKIKTMDFAVNSDSLFSLRHGKCVLKWVFTIVEFLEVLGTEAINKNIFEQIAHYVRYALLPEFIYNPNTAFLAMFTF